MMSQVQEEEFMCCSLYNGIKLDKRGRIIMMNEGEGEEVEALSVID